VSRLKALGNAVVPAQIALIFRAIMSIDGKGPSGKGPVEQKTL
jgi:hypothetical protein